MQDRGNYVVIRDMENHSEENFYGRSELLEQLYDLCGKSVASLVTCRGRRRVGK